MRLCHLWKFGVPVAVVGVMTGCLPRPGTHGQDGGGGEGGSVAASVEGISDEDKKRDDLKYWLKCKDGDNAVDSVQGVLKKIDGEEFVVFPSSHLKDGLKCAMEIRSDEKNFEHAEDYDWFGVDKAGKPVVYLLYGSSVDEINNRSLKLTLYKLYAEKKK